MPMQSFADFMATREAEILKLPDWAATPEYHSIGAGYRMQKRLPEILRMCRMQAEADNSDPFVAQRVYNHYKLGIADMSDYRVSKRIEYEKRPGTEPGSEIEVPHTIFYNRAIPCI